MSDTLNRVMAQAEDAANNAVSTNVPAVQQGGGNSVAQRPSLDSLMDSSGISVDEYLTIKDTGFRLDGMKGTFDEMVVEINTNDIVTIVQARGNQGGNTTFIKSYDGNTTPQGQSFEQALQHLRNTNEKVDGPYQTAEIPMVLLEDVSDNSKEKTTVAAGRKIGTTPPVTGVKFLSAFLKKLRDEGLIGQTLKVKLIHTPQRNNKGNEWGVADYQVVTD